MMLTNHALRIHHGYSFTELEDMIPWERTIYVELVNKWVKEEQERIDKRNAR